MGEIRFCVDCRFYKKVAHEAARCLHGNATRPPEDYLVTGQLTTQRVCQELRGDRAACGRDAAWFEPRVHGHG